MSKQSVANRVQEQLEQALASGALPDELEERAEQLLTRMKEPIRVAVMGAPRSGKSRLLNFLVGSEVIPENVPHSTIQLLHGETTECICTLPDGEEAKMPHAELARVSLLSPVFVELHLPLAALGKISVLEVVAPADPTSLERAMQWAAQRTDVTLWCSQIYDREEQALWAKMPDLIKDHAFLMLTKADILQENGSFDMTVDTARASAGDEFLQVLPIATLDAIAARQPDGSVDKNALRDSGGTALISSVLKQVELGRQTAVDLADMLLHQHADLIEAAANAPQTSKAAPKKPASEEPKPTASKPEKPETAAAPKPELAPAAPEVAAPSQVITLRPATRDAFAHAVDYLTNQGNEMMKDVTETGEAAAPDIMDRSVIHIQWLSDYLFENGDDADDALHRNRDAAMDAADLVQLMQLENNDKAAVEALALMIQLKRELQADIAA